MAKRVVTDTNGSLSKEEFAVPEKIYTLVEDNPVTIQKGEDGDLDGNFDEIDWHDLKVTGEGLLGALTSSGLITANECYLTTALRRALSSAALYPSVKVLTTIDVPDELKSKIAAICSRYAKSLLPSNYPSETGDLLGESDDAPLSGHEKRVIDECSMQTISALRRRLKHPIKIESGEKNTIAIIEGRLRRRETGLVTKPSRSQIEGVVDCVGRSDFSVRIIDSRGTFFIGNYDKRESLPTLGELMLSMQTSQFELIRVSDENGRELTTINPLISCATK